MKEGRNEAAAVVVGGGEMEKMFIVGGSDGDDCDFKVMSSTEYITLEGGAQYGPELPLAVTGHCLVTMANGKMAISMFGSDSESIGIKRTFLFNFTSEKWSEGPRTIHVRGGPLCGSVIDSQTRQHVVVAVGGVDLENLWSGQHTSKLEESELWIEGTPGWIVGPRMLANLANGAATTNAEGSRLILMGGTDFDNFLQNAPESDEVFYFQCSSLVCLFEKATVTMTYKRFSFVAVKIPDSWSECTTKSKSEDFEEDNSDENLLEVYGDSCF